MNSFKSSFKSKADRNKAIVILQKARELIVNESEDWVCCAIREVPSLLRDRCNWDRQGVCRIAERLRNNIRNSLNGHTFVTDWLMEEHNLSASKVYAHQKEYRLLWIDSMIADLGAMNV